MRKKLRTTRRDVLTATGTFSLLGVAGIAAGNSPTVTNAPVPDEPGTYTYPTMGTDADAPTARIYGNFKCPHTQEFVFGNLEAIVDEFVATGRLNLQFYNLAYEPGDTSSYFISSSDPRIAAVGIGIWDEDPEGYWRFHAETFEDVPVGSVDYEELASRARSAGVSNVDEIVDRARAGDYDDDVEQVAAAADDDGVGFTPTLVLGGETTAPHHGERAILDWIESRLEDDPSDVEADEESDDQNDSGEDEADGDAEEGTDDEDGEPDDGEAEESSDGDDSTAASDDSDEEDEPAESVDDPNELETGEAGDDEFEWVEDAEETDTEEDASDESDSSGGCP